MIRIKRWTKTALPVLLIIIAAFSLSVVSADNRTGITLGSGAVTKGSQVYFGNYNSEPVLWRVMGADNNKDETSTHGMLLLSDKILTKIQFNQVFEAAEPSNWQGSLAQKWCGDFYSSNFTAVEQSAVIRTSKKDERYLGKHGHQYGISKLVDQFVFFLSAEEAEKIYFPYDDDSSRREPSAEAWWLRSPDEWTTALVAFVQLDGGVRSIGPHFTIGARPAFNLNLSSVLFSSLIPSSSNQYKLTLKDSALTITPGDVTRSGDVITVSYSISGTNAGDGTKAYVLVTNKAYTENGAKVLAYTALTAGAEAGTGTFTLDSSWGRNYNVYLLAVNEGGEKKTDTASKPAAITLSDEPDEPDEPESQHRFDFFRFCGECELPATGFSTLQPTSLSEQSKDLRYSPVRMHLLIPILDQGIELVTVPRQENSWAVEWLGKEGGILEGSALPGEGLSLVAAHNTLNDTEYGPFALLATLEINDLISVADDEGSLKLFRVYANELLEPGDMATLAAIAGEEENPLILVTCENESPDGGYLNRRIIFAR